MNTEQQFRWAQALMVFSGVFGFVITGMGFGFWLSVQTALRAGCRNQVIVEPTACQLAMQTMGSRATLTSILGIGLVATGGAGLYYLRQQVP